MKIRRKSSLWHFSAAAATMTPPTMHLPRRILE
jgi:hypothetical protein